MASTRRILDLLAVQPTILPGGRRLARPVRGELELRDVGFAYGSGAQVLRGLELEVPAGETHAVAGLTGSGKSTIVKLVLRFYDPGAGAVLLDGVDVRDLAFAELRGVDRPRHPARPGRADPRRGHRLGRRRDRGGHPTLAWRPSRAGAPRW